MLRILMAALAACLLASPALAQTPFTDGMTQSSKTPANASHAAGTSVGGLFTLPMSGFRGELRNFYLRSTGGSTGSYVVRIWARQPTASTCTDNVAFAGSTTDDALLLTAPFTVTPAAPASTTGDASTYAVQAGLALDFLNKDVPQAGSLYVCLVTVATDTADQNNVVVVSVSGLIF